MKNRIQTVIKQIERDENTDLGKILVLQALDAALSDAIFVEESLARQEIADVGIAG